jgi:hypothetical protein
MLGLVTVSRSRRDAGPTTAYTTSSPPPSCDPLIDGRSAFPDEPGPSPEDQAWAAAEFARKWGEDPPAQIRDARGLLLSIAEHLASLGLEPDVRGDAIDFLFLGRLHRVELEDVEARLDRGQVSEEELAIMAAGLPVG